MKKILYIFLIITLSYYSKCDTIILSKQKLNESIEKDNKLNEYFNYIKLSLNSNILPSEEEIKLEVDDKKLYLPGFEKIDFNVKKVLEIDLNESNSNGETATIIAIEYKNNEALKYFLEKKVNLDIRHPILGKYPIQTAIYFENLEAVKLLLEYDNNMVNIQNDVDGWTPLEEATLKGNIEIVKLLLNNGADPLLKDKKGNTALDLAVNFGKGEIVKALRDKIKEIRHK